jgi:hypothetical protein
MLLFALSLVAAYAALALLYLNGFRRPVVAALLVLLALPAPARAG